MHGRLRGASHPPKTSLATCLRIFVGIPWTHPFVVTTTVRPMRPLVSVIICLQFSLGLWVPLASAKAKTNPSVDSDYVLALGTANDFLRAWQTQDREAGILLLTDQLKQRTSEDALVSFFSCMTGKSQSFEIAHGKKVAPGRYRFPVSLFQRPANSGTKWLRPQSSSLVVVRTNEREWSIDKLP
jgi:hypothetical protein